MRGFSSSDSVEATVDPGTDLEVPAEVTVAGVPVSQLAKRRTAGETFSQADIDLMLDGVRPNTRATGRRAWRRVLEFTGEHGYDELPMPVETCVKMIEAQWRRPGRYGRPTSPQTIKLMLWMVTKAHEMARRPDGTIGYVSPAKQRPVRDAFSGYKWRWRGAGHRPDKATAIEPEELTAMIATCDLRSPVGVRDALALALGYDMGARARELCSVLYEDVEVHVDGAAGHDVDPEHPEAIPLLAGDRLVVHVPDSKTDQEGDGDEVVIPAHPAEHAATCPVRLWLAWEKRRERDGLDSTGLVMRDVLHRGPLPKDGRPRKGKIGAGAMTYRQYEQLFMRAVHAAGLVNPKGRRRHFTLHGLRAGAASKAAEEGADTPELNRHFRWSQRGTTSQQYAARGLKRRKNPARRIWAVTPRKDSDA